MIISLELHVHCICGCQVQSTQTYTQRNNSTYPPIEPIFFLNVHTIHTSTSRCTCNNKEMIFQCKLNTHNTVDPGFGGRGLSIFIPIGEFPSHDSEGNGGSAATCIATCSSYLLVNLMLFTCTL